MKDKMALEGGHGVGTAMSHEVHAKAVGMEAVWPCLRAGESVHGTESEIKGGTAMDKTRAPGGLSNRPGNAGSLGCCRDNSASAGAHGATCPRSRLRQQNRKTKHTTAAEQKGSILRPGQAS